MILQNAAEPVNGSAEGSEGPSYTFHEQVHLEIGGLHVGVELPEAEPAVPSLKALPEDVNGDATGADHLGRSQSHRERMEHKLGPDASSLVTPDNGQTGKEREWDRISTHTRGKALGCFFTLHRVVDEAVVADDAVTFGYCNVGPGPATVLCGECVALEVEVEALLTAVEVRGVVAWLQWPDVELGGVTHTPKSGGFTSPWRLYRGLRQTYSPTSVLEQLCEAVNDLVGLSHLVDDAIEDSVGDDDTTVLCDGLVDSVESCIDHKGRHAHATCLSSQANSG